MHLVQLCILVALLCSDAKDVGNRSDTSLHGAVMKSGATVLWCCIELACNCFYVVYT